MEIILLLTLGAYAAGAMRWQFRLTAPVRAHLSILGAMLLVEVKAILDDYPGLTREDVQACLAYAHAVIANDSLDAVRVGG